MMKNFFPAIGLLLILASCGNHKQEKAKDETLPAMEQSVANDSTAIRQVIRDFYSWYKDHYERLMDFQLYSSIKKNDGPPYAINWSQVEKYQAFIKDSVPQLGQAFLESQRMMLQECDSAFKVDTEDEIPYGFDYDWYTNSQEDPEYYSGEVNKPLAWKMRVNGEEAQVEVTGAYEDNGVSRESVILSLLMKKEKGRWTIARIGNE